MASFFRRVSAALLFGGSALVSVFVLPGCGDDPAPSPARCTGVTRDGQCIAKCVASRDCTGTQVCSPIDAEEGLCYAGCTEDKNCEIGSVCVAGVDMSGAPLKLCHSRKLENLPDNGFGVACTDDAQCDTAHGLTCGAGKCSLPLQSACTAPSQCASGACDAGKCVLTCVGLANCPAGTACEGLGKPGVSGVCRAQANLAAGQYSQACPKGNECDAAAGFACIGLAGDFDAFCSKIGGCAADSECPQGYWCGGVRSGDVPEGQIPPSERTCVKRGFCSPCETDVDCGFTFGSKCVPDANGAKFCSTSCTPDKRSCRFGASCVDVGGGDYACRPDAGACAPVEAPKGCDPCRNDLDCGPGGFCLGSTIPGAIDKPSVRWCAAPCGAPDADGKRTCPKSVNGVEMVCLDENNLDVATRALGVPTGTGADATVPFLPGLCYPAFTFDNEVSYQVDPPKGVCGNGLREAGEECDDANKSTVDGCADCKITADCRFTVNSDNSDETPTLTGKDGKTVSAMPTKCRSFLVEGALEAGGDIDVVDFEMSTNLTSALAEVFTGEIDTCDADLVLEIRDGQKPNVAVPCSDLLPPTLRFASMFQCQKSLGCGSCDANSGLCGLCDDDNGLGNCPRVIFDRVSSYDGAAVINASAHKWMRIRARDTAAVVPAYKLLVTGLKGDTSNPGALVNGAQLTCW